MEISAGPCESCHSGQVSPYGLRYAVMTFRAR